MAEKDSKFKNAVGKVGDFLNHISNIFDSDDPTIVVPYRGFSNDDRLFMKGRVLENEDIFTGKTGNELRNLVNSFKRFETDEIAGAEVSIKIQNQLFSARTDEEGYYTIETPWTAPVNPPENNWITAEVVLPKILNETGKTVSSPAEVYVPSRNADYGIITDVDDTILQTHVASRFKLKMLYATFLQDAEQRKPMEGMVQALQEFEKGSDGQKKNPVFYVSHSPWNIYDILEQFLEVQEFPAGPLLLRDFGWSPVGNYADHKSKTITQILEMYPDLPFILLGDAAEKDTDFYLDLAHKYPDRIKSIYIRQVRDTKNARRIAKLIKQNSEVDVLLFSSSDELFEHARSKEFLA